MPEPADRHQHLTLIRSEPINPRRTGGGFGPRPPPDPQQHGEKLRNELDATVARPVAEVGFDPRRLLKLEVEGVEPDALQAIPGIEVVSQEEKTLVVLFASEEGLLEFRQRLDLLSRGQRPTRQDVLFAIKGVGEWGPNDRVGPALRREGLPRAPQFTLDIELWPLERRGPDRRRMLEEFSGWCERVGATIVDQVDQDAIVLVRLKTSREAYERLLEHRDVRLVDLPPRLQLAESDLQLTVSNLGSIPPLPSNAPVVGILDSGIASNHPLLEGAVGDAQTFIPTETAADEHGHGTAVAGLAIYGDIAACIENGSFVPHLRIVSGRITDQNAENDSGFVENHITAAVEYFVENYGCRIFNLSFGDRRKPYTGGHVRGLAVTLDTLSRTHGALFVVSAGNYEGTDADPPPRWKSQYPRYLLDRESARILDPAPALNALTVGSLARFEVPRAAQRYVNDPAYHPVARTDQPSPFSRGGPGPGGAVKPEIVAHGGNFAVDLRAGEARLQNALLGEPAPAHDFATSGWMLRDFVGTSYAAPHITNLAGRLSAEYPTASNNLLRALIVAHAGIPAACEQIAISEQERRRLVGYGFPEAEHCLFSAENCVSLLAEERIGEEQHHFYEIPLPEDFLVHGRRRRSITIALAHTPVVRTTRFDYRASRVSFRVVAHSSLAAVTRVFTRTPRDQREANIKEFRTPNVRPRTRDKGTVQAATYEVRKLDQRTRIEKLFVVVTRSVPNWSRGWAPEEAYALVAVLQDRSEQDVRYYQQIVALQQRLRARV